MSSSADDITLFNHAVEDYDSTVLFKDMKFVEVKDSTSTGGNYSSEITFDLNVLQSQADSVSLENTLIQFPVVGQLKCIAPGGTPVTVSASNFVGSFKNGFHQFVNSATLKIGNKTIAEECQFTNSLVSFKMLTEFNKEQLDKFGKMLNVNKEGLDAAGSASTINAAFTSFHTANTGMKISDTTAAAERLGWFAADESNPTSLMSIVNGPNSAISGIGQGYYEYKGSAAAAGAVEYEIVAIASIRLVDLIDVVKVLPMLKSCSGSLNIKLNAGKTTITATDSTASNNTFSHEVYRGNTHPGLIQKFGALGSSGTATYEWKVEASGNPVLANTPIMKYARMLVASYTPNATTESVLMQPKSIRYGQWTHYQFDVGAGSTFNENLTSGITNPKRMVLVPVISGSGSSGKAVLSDPYTSPFENIGWTTSPCVALSQLNARVGNHSLFNTPIDLSNEYFFGQLQKGVSGSREDGMVSGLLTQHDFDTLYRYVAFDLSRRLETEDGSKKSLSVSGKNLSKFQITIHAFYESEKACTVDPSLCVITEN